MSLAIMNKLGDYHNHVNQKVGSIAKRIKAVKQCQAVSVGLSEFMFQLEQLCEICDSVFYGLIVRNKDPIDQHSLDLIKQFMGHFQNIL